MKEPCSLSLCKQKAIFMQLAVLLSCPGLLHPAWESDFRWAWRQCLNRTSSLQQLHWQERRKVYSKSRKRGMKKSVECWISNWVLVPGCFIFQQLLPLFCSAKGDHCILLEPYRISEHLNLQWWKPVMKRCWEKTWQFLSGTKRCVDFPRWQGKLWYR